MRLRAPRPERRAPADLADLAAGPVGDRLHATRRSIATAPVFAAAVLTLAVLPGLGAHDAVRASSAPVVIDTANAGPWRADLQRVASAWNAIGLGRRVRIVALRAPDSAVVVQLGRVAAACGRGTAACVVTRGPRIVLVLPRVRDPWSAAGAGPATLVAHEVGHLLGLGHRSTGCTVMRAEPSARGCDQRHFTRTIPAPNCSSQTLRTWRCRTVEQRLELCGPTAEDAARVLRRSGLPPQTAAPRLCVARELSGPSPRAARHARNAGLRVIVANEGAALLRAARRHDSQTRRWCARSVELPAAARRLCAIARA